MVAAKRSLSSIHLVHRATTILSDARAAIETTATLIARTKYLRRSLASQLKILRGVQFEIEGAAQAIKSEIQTVILGLEQTDRTLAENIEVLKATRVEDGFKNRDVTGTMTEQDAIIKDTLHDFVDDKPVEELKTDIQSAIDNVEAAETRMDDSMRLLEEDLNTVNAALNSERTATSSSTSSTLQTPHISRTLRNLEAHAHEMAVSLESLVKHFDLCVMAIKHTEGAGALAEKTVNAADLPDGGIDVLYDTPSRPLTDEERIEMLSVLSNDAEEVDEVVMELSDRAAEMENKLESLQRWRKTNEQIYNEVEGAFKLLEKVSTRLPSHLIETTHFASSWETSRTQITDGQNALSDLSSVYTQFLDAYDGLIVEVARRRGVKKQMMKIVEEAHRKLEDLYEDDLNEREIFRNKQGDFLPSDIWSGLGDAPGKWEFRRTEGEESVPELPRTRVEEALRRLKGSGRNG